MRSGGNGSMYINNQEYKFRGENQLMKLIGENFAAISKLIPKDAFKVKQPEVPDYLKTSVVNTINVENILPKELQSIKIEKTELSGDKVKIYFMNGVDSTGQVYSVYYNQADESLYTEVDSETSIEANPTKKLVNNSIKIIKDYLKSLDKQA